MLKKKFGPIFKELLKFLPKKCSICSQIYGFGIRDPEKTYSGSRIQWSKRHRIPDPGSGSATLVFNQEVCFEVEFAKGEHNGLPEHRNVKRLFLNYIFHGSSKILNKNNYILLVIFEYGTVYP
jgi:hypothetical protein